jgi:hypothetical protein
VCVCVCVCVLRASFQLVLVLTRKGTVCMGLLRRSLGGWVDPVNLVDYHSVRQMFPVLLTFYGSVYSNMKVRV